MKTPYPFQVIGAEKMSSSTGFLLADECGLGKTITAIEAVKRARTSEKFKALVVCPPSITAQWVDVIKSQDPGCEVGTTEYVPYDFKGFNGWAVTTYYELRDDTMLRALGSVVWDFIVADEAHKIKNRKTSFAKKIKKLSGVSTYALTATPMEKPSELWSLLHYIRPDLVEPYWAWVKKHLEVKDGWYTKWDIGDPLDPVAFGDYLRPFMLKRTKEEVMPNLPERMVFEIPVEMESKQKKIYEQIKQSKDIVVEVEDKELLIQNVLTLITRLQQVSTSPQLLGFPYGSGKLAWLTEFLDNNPNEPVAIFTRFRKVVETLVEKYKGAMVAGGINQSEEFGRGDYQYVFCVIADSLQGVDGLQRADNAVFLDSHWSSTQMTQAIDRVHRMDIKNPKNVYFLHSTHEDRLVLNAVDRKWSQQQLVYYFIKGVSNGQ